MKSFAVVFVLCFASALAALSEEQIAKLREHKEGCIAETGVDRAVVDDVKKGVYADNDEKLDCFTACMLKKIGVMNADGTHNEEVTRSKVPADVPKENVDELIKKCGALYGGPNVCETGAKVIKCFMETKTFSLF